MLECALAPRLGPQCWPAGPLTLLDLEDLAVGRALHASYMSGAGWEDQGDQFKGTLGGQISLM